MTEMPRFRACFLPSIETGAKTFITDERSNAEGAKALLDEIANYTLHLQDLGLMSDYSNAGYVEQFIDGDWEEVEEDED